MDPVTFWTWFPAFLGIGGIAFSCGMLWYFMKFCRPIDVAQRNAGTTSYTSFALSSLLMFGILVTFVLSVTILVSGILGILCS